MIGGSIGSVAGNIVVIVGILGAYIINVILGKGIGKILYFVWFVLFLILLYIL